MNSNVAATRTSAAKAPGGIGDFDDEGRRMSRGPQYRFRLYVAGDAHNSTRALANLNALCRVHLAHRHHIEVVNVFREPERARADGIFMTPTLVKVAPGPGRQIVGSLSPTHALLCALGVESAQAIAA